MQNQILHQPVLLIDDAGEVIGPDNRVYSTSPRVGVCSDLKTYHIKGHNCVGVVTAESSAYLLAQEFELPVPCWSFIEGGHPHLLFGSETINGFDSAVTTPTQL